MATLARHEMVLGELRSSPEDTGLGSAPPAAPPGAVWIARSGEGTPLGAIGRLPARSETSPARGLGLPPPLSHVPAIGQRVAVGLVVHHALLHALEPHV